MGSRMEHCRCRHLDTMVSAFCVFVFVHKLDLFLSTGDASVYV